MGDQDANPGICNSKALDLFTPMKLDQKIVPKLICMSPHLSFTLAKAHKLNKDEILHYVQKPFVETLFGI